MIEVRDLKKTYATKKTFCEALKGVSFTLPESGLVFILGKSGSGKSTLLNILGGLDTMTDGDVIVDGKSYKDFSLKDFDNFRNEKLGFIFQDFCLIEGESVYDNIRLVRELQNSNDDGIYELLKEVGLEGLENRYPKELSAGQKQRVAIARAIAKNPKIILADEPTGNIDSKTSKVVLDMLKEMSKDRLIVIISHNADDALHYGDRIIELADGRIINDQTRAENYSDELIVRDNEIVLPYNKKLTNDEIVTINSLVKERSGDVSIDQNDSGFKITEQPVARDTFGEYTGKGLSKKGIWNLTKTFIKKRWISMLILTLGISFLMIVFGLAQVFTMFDGSTQIEENIKKNGDSGLSVSKGYLKENDYGEEKYNFDIMCPITDEDVETIKSAYDGKVYLMYNICIPITGKYYNIEANYKLAYSSFYKFYSQGTNGILVCDNSYLTHIFGKITDDKVIAGQIDDKITDDDYVIMTDYIADSILYYKYGKDFKEILGENLYDEILNNGPLIGRVRVGAIIDTDYETKFEPFKNIIETEGVTKKNKSEVQNYVRQLINKYAVMYNLNDNFKEDYVKDYCSAGSAIFAYSNYTEFEFDNKDPYDCYSGYFDFIDGLQEDEIMIGVTTLNDILGTAYEYDDLSVIPEVLYKDKTIKIKMAYTPNSDFFYEKTFKIVGVYSAGRGALSKSLFEEFKDYSVNPTAMFLESATGALDIYDLEDTKGFKIINSQFSLEISVLKIVKIFDDIFFYIGLALCVIIIGTLAFFATSLVKRNSYDIGVIRSMGGRTKEIGIVFSIQMLIIGLAICVITFLGNYLGIVIFNGMLQDSIAVYVNNPEVANLTLLTFNAGTLFIDVGIIVLLTLISAIFPLLAVRKINIIKIIKSRE